MTPLFELLLTCGNYYSSYVHGQNDFFTSKNLLESACSGTVLVTTYSGAGTRSHAPIIADVAFISLWHLHREKTRMVATNSCVFQTVKSAKYTLYTCVEAIERILSTRTNLECQLVFSCRHSKMAIISNISSFLNAWTMF